MAGKQLSIFLHLTLTSFLVLANSLSYADSTAEKAAIEKVMQGTWDKPNSPIHVDPIVAISDYAVAGWIQDDMGGRALLRRKDSEWLIVLCSGDALKSADALIRATVPATTAAALAKALEEAERLLDPAKRAKLSKFDGLVMMEPAGSHPDHR